MPRVDAAQAGRIVKEGAADRRKHWSPLIRAQSCARHEGHPRKASEPHEDRGVEWRIAVPAKRAKCSRVCQDHRSTSRQHDARTGILDHRGHEYQYRFEPGKEKIRLIIRIIVIEKTQIKEGLLACSMDHLFAEPTLKYQNTHFECGRLATSWNVVADFGRVGPVQLRAIAHKALLRNSKNLLHPPRGRAT